MTKTCIVPVLTLLLLLLGGLTDSHGFERTRTESGAAFSGRVRRSRSICVSAARPVALSPTGVLVGTTLPKMPPRDGMRPARSLSFSSGGPACPPPLCADDGLNTVGWASTSCGMPFGPASSP